MLTNFQKKIYNTFLQNSRFGLLYKLRKDFLNLDPKVQHILQRLENFFTKYSYIKLTEYFEAPRVLHPDEKYPMLDFFLTRGAIKTYSIYKKQKEDQNPELQFEEIKESLRFIGMFCFKEKIKPKDYLKHQNGYLYSWINHYREHKINPYSIMELGDINNIFLLLSEDEKELFSNTMLDKFESFKNRYHSSTKTKQYVKTLTKKIEEFLKSS